MILIAGDSWGCGAWKNYKVYHRGLEQYLYDSGYSVVNISCPAGSNENTVERLDHYLDSYTYQPPIGSNNPINKIFVFQTEWHRAADQFRPGQGKQLVLRPDIADWFEFRKVFDDQKILIHFYNQLSHISQKHNIPIHIIGGCADTIWLDEFEKKRSPGINIACQSMINLLLEDCASIDRPVFAYEMPERYLTNAKQTNDLQLLDYVLDMVDAAQKRIKLFENNPDWFPDAAHANHQGHKKLFDYLKKQGII